LWLSTVVAVILVGAGAVAWIIYQIAKQLRTLKTGKEEKKVANPPQYANPKYTAKEMLTAIEAAKTINELKDAIEKYFPGSVNNLVYGMGQVIETSKQLNGDTQTLAIIQGIIEEIRTSWEEKPVNIGVDNIAFEIFSNMVDKVYRPQLENYAKKLGLVEDAKNPGTIKIGDLVINIRDANHRLLRGEVAPDFLKFVIDKMIDKLISRLANPHEATARIWGTMS